VAFSSATVSSLLLVSSDHFPNWGVGNGHGTAHPLASISPQIQHISIAVMFWFAGLVAMSLESRRLLRWLAAISITSLKSPSGGAAELTGYGDDFSPFPALVVGVTGVAMSAHFQTYLFQVSATHTHDRSMCQRQGKVQIHALWGYCLKGFAVLCCLIYFFVLLGPLRIVLSPVLHRQP
jgi:hypothetical protein